MTRILDRIERELGMPGLASALVERLGPSDLQSLLLEIFRLRAQRRSPSAILSNYEANRFVRPSAVSPLQLAQWDRVAFSQLPPEFEPIELSPVCPLGTCSGIAAVSQNWAVSTARNTEVVSDSANVLALEAALRRRLLLRSDPRSNQVIHLASSHRLLRAQHYRDPGLIPHFRLFALCSAGRDIGSFRFEIDVLALHIHFYLSALRAFLGPSPHLRVSVTVDGSIRVPAGLIDGLFADIGEAFDRVECTIDASEQSGRSYYDGLRFKIHAESPSGRELELVDGGAVDWTQRLLSDAKERLIISGIGSERVCTEFSEGNAI
jgi:hypothetical protein